VWIVPAVVVLVDVAAGTPSTRGRRTAALAAAAVYAVFVLSVTFFVSDPAGYPTATGPWAVLAANADVLVMLGLLAFLPVRQLRPVAPSAERTTAPPPPAGSSPR
jgi:alpha-1,2-mannosyltransferase